VFRLSRLDDQQRKDQHNCKDARKQLAATEGQLPQAKNNLNEPVREAKQLPDDRDVLLARLLAERDQWERQRKQTAAEFCADQDRLVQQQNDLTAQLQSARDRCAELAAQANRLQGDKQKLFNRFNSALNSRDADEKLRRATAQENEKALADERNKRIEIEQQLTAAQQQITEIHLQLTGAQQRLEAGSQIAAQRAGQLELAQRRVAELQEREAAARTAQQRLEGEKAALTRSLQEQREQSAQQQREMQTELQRQIATLQRERDSAMAQLQKQQREHAAAIAAATATSSYATERNDLERSQLQLAQQLVQQEQRGRALEQQLAQASADQSQLRSQLDLARQQLQRVSADAIQAKDAHAALSRQLAGVTAENQRMSQTNQLLHRQALAAEAEMQRNKHANVDTAALQRSGNSCRRSVLRAGWLGEWSWWCCRVSAESPSRVQLSVTLSALLFPSVCDHLFPAESSRVAQLESDLRVEKERAATDVRSNPAAHDSTTAPLRSLGHERR